MFRMNPSAKTARTSAILLLGAPGSGKSLLGNMLQKDNPRRLQFLSVGETVRICDIVVFFFLAATVYVLVGHNLTFRLCSSGRRDSWTMNCLLLMI